MKKRFHHIYIEITNRCNLACSFCPKTNRKVEDMSYENFCKIIDQVVEYTSMIYLHVMGEPLLHQDVEKMIRYANEKGLMVGITTNGVLLDKHVAMFHDMNIKRINLSLYFTSHPPRLYFICLYHCKFGVRLCIGVLLR